MTPDNFGEGVLRIFPGELPQQIQIACHSFESISPPKSEIRQIFLPLPPFHKRQFHNLCQTLAHRCPQRQLVSDLVRLAADVAEGNVCVERRRFHRAGDVADFFSVEK